MWSDDQAPVEWDGEEEIFQVPNLSVKEGKRKMISHFRRERDSKLRRLKIQSFLQGNKRLICEICAFDFEAFYGEVGRGFIEVHHYVPLSKLDEHTLDSNEALLNLKLLCANCHRMVHRGDPVAMFDTLQQSFQSQSSNPK